MKYFVRRQFLTLTFSLGLIAGAPCLAAGSSGPAPAVVTVPGMPPVVNPANLYSETTADKLQPHGRRRSVASVCS